MQKETENKKRLPLNAQTTLKISLTFFLIYKLFGYAWCYSHNHRVQILEWKIVLTFPLCFWIQNSLLAFKWFENFSSMMLAFLKFTRENSKLQRAIPSWQQISSFIIPDLFIRCSWLVSEFWTHLSNYFLYFWVFFCCMVAGSWRQLKLMTIWLKWSSLPCFQKTLWRKGKQKQNLWFWFIMLHGLLFVVPTLLFSRKRQFDVRLLMNVLWIKDLFKTYPERWSKQIFKILTHILSLTSGNYHCSKFATSNLYLTYELS